MRRTRIHPTGAAILSMVIFMLMSGGAARPQSAPQWENLPACVKERKSFRRLEWFYLPRLDATGVFPSGLIASRRAAEELKGGDGAVCNWNGWKSLGPVGIDFSADPMVSHWGVVSGRVRGLAVHPLHPDIVYAGAGGGGIWKSVNGGQSWTDISGGLNLLTFGAIAIDPSNPDVIYAGTGEYLWVLKERFYNGDGIYKSTDAGATWTRLEGGFGDATYITAVAVSPHDPSVVLMSVVENMQGAPSNQGIWRSADAGAHWTRVTEQGGVFDLAFHPADPELVYATSGENRSDGGFLISADGGITFHRSNAGLPAAEKIGRIQFDLCRSVPSVLYTVIYNTEEVSAGRNTCAYTSHDGGLSWSQVSPGANLAGLADQGFYDLCLAVNPDNPNQVFIGNVELSRSVDGATFSYCRNPNALTGGSGAFDSYTHLDHHVVRFAPSDPTIVYVGCDGGVFRSSDGGKTFASASRGISSVMLYRVASHNTNPDVIFAGAQDNGFLSTSDKGLIPWNLLFLGDGTECFMDYSNENNIYFATFAGSFGGSRDGGKTWEPMVDPPNFDSSAFLCPYWQDPTNPHTLYGCLKQKLYRSQDEGRTWAYTTTGPIVSTPICSAAQSPVASSHIMVAARYGTVSLVASADGGEHWNDITGNPGTLSGGYFMRLIGDPADGNSFYLLKSSYSGGIVLRTTDFGLTWSDMTGDLPLVPASDLFIDTLGGRTLYLGNDFGVYRSVDEGQHWVRLGEGMPFVPVLDFDLFSHNGNRLLRAATFGRGVFELDLKGLSAVPDPADGDPSAVALDQNFPNPITDETHIRFEVRRRGQVTLKVYDVLGKEVCTLVDEVKTSGTYQVLFNRSGLPAGFYSYRLRMGELTAVRKMTLLK